MEYINKCQFGLPEHSLTILCVLCCLQYLKEKIIYVLLSVANKNVTMTSNGKHFTVTPEMLKDVARDQSVQLKVNLVPRHWERGWLRVWPDGISVRFSKVAFVSFCYIAN